LKISELRALTLLEILDLLEKGETSSVELVNLLIDQIKRTDTKVRAYVTVCEKNAVEFATIADEKRKSEKSKKGLPLLHGIPVSFKDNIETKGVRTTCGSKILKNNIPKKDATVVARLKAAGAMVLGKVNTHEFAQGPVTPPTRNPWNLERIPGGSSGGSGAAVGATSALAALGSDTGGSIRMPAAVCGVVGFKPTYGLVSRYGLFPASWSLDHIGPICRRVEDVALLTMLMSGRDARDPTTSERSVRNYPKIIRRDIKGLRIGIPKNHFFEGCDKRIAKSIYSAIDVLKDLGCIPIEFLFPDAPKMLAARLVIDSCESAAYHAKWLSKCGGDYQHDVRLALEQGSIIPATHYIHALRYRTVAIEKIVHLFNEFDLIITPTMLMVAPRVGDEINEDAIMHCTGAFNLLGLPALTVPCGFVEGLPVGVQMVGNLFDEGRVLAVGNAYEEVSKFYLKNPPISQLGSSF
jgi:aspartyl-tRNA(Asn)/glutamyl-tRNA(Gln) amidotransferase subunit A